MTTMLSLPSSSLLSELGSSTEVSVGECFPVEDSPARSAECISWGPHNVLQLCTRWHVFLFLGSLLRPACQRCIRSHPLSHRGSMQSVEAVVGAKWSPTLLPEISYPASARLCVVTSSNLIVYRVTRRGNNQVEVSHGVGVACCRSCSQGMVSDEVRKVVAASASSVVATCRPAGGKSDLDSEDTAAMDSAEVSLLAKVKNAAKNKRMASDRGKKRRKLSSSSSSSTSSCSDGSDGDEVDVANSSRSSGDATGSGGFSPTSLSAPSTSLTPEALRNDKHPTNAGDNRAGHLSKGRGCAGTRSCTGRSNVEPKPQGTSNEGGCLVDYAWLGNDDLLVCTSEGLYAVAFSGDVSDDDGPTIRALPPPAYLWGSATEVAAVGFRVPTPSCMSTLFIPGFGLAPEASDASSRLRGLVIVASPFILRLLRVSRVSSTSAETQVQLIGIVEVPSLTSVPVSVCTVAMPPLQPTAPSTTSSQPTGDMDAVVYVAAPGMVLRGRFTLDPFVSASPSPSLLPLPLTCPRGLWQVEVRFWSDSFPGEVSLRRLMVAPFVVGVADANATSGVALKSQLASSSPLTRSSCTPGVTVVGVGEKAVYAFFSCSPSTLRLLQCPLLAGCCEMPDHHCAAVAGMALHPSGTVAVTAVQTGRVNREPTHLWPMSVCRHDGWLKRLIEVGGLVYHGDAQRGVGRSGDSSERNEATDILWVLRQQITASFFFHERLLSESVTQSSELHHYAQAYDAVHQPPTLEMLTVYRRFLEMRDGAALLHFRVFAGMSLRCRYLQLRGQYGVDLFLRWPMHAPHQSGDAVGKHSILASPDIMETFQLSWPWWRVLRQLWLDCPWDRPVLSELVLANAVLVIAKRHHYAGMALEESESFREATQDSATLKGREDVVDADNPLGNPSGCSTRPDILDAGGAVAFLETYMAMQEAALHHSNGSAASQFDKASLITVSDCAKLSAILDDKKIPSSQLLEEFSQSQPVHWCVSPTWVTSLKTFLRSTAYPDRSDTRPAPLLFPCSLCDRRESAVIQLGLTSTSKHVPLSDGTATQSASPMEREQSHTTLFSGTTLSPLSLFSEDYVLTRCLSCGLSDYADGPLCRVCGGLLE